MRRLVAMLQLVCSDKANVARVGHGSIFQSPRYLFARSMSNKVGQSITYLEFMTEGVFRKSMYREMLASRATCCEKRLPGVDMRLLFTAPPPAIDNVTAGACTSGSTQGSKTAPCSRRGRSPPCWQFATRETSV